MRQRVLRLLMQEYSLIFLLSFLMVSCTGFHYMRNFDFSQATDSITYWAISHFDFHQSPVRRYRIIVPVLAKCVSKVYLLICKLFGVQIIDQNFPLKFSFMIVNTTFVSLYLTLIYRFCRLYALKWLPSLIGVLFMLSSYITIFVVAAPLVDSFLWFILALMLVGIKEKKHAYVYVAIFLGPFAKESFIFFVPVIFFFSDVPKLRQIGAFLLSGLIVFGFRYLVDHANNLPADESAHRHLQFIYEMRDTMQQIYDIHVFEDFMEAFGFWPLVLFAGAFLIKGYFRKLKPYWPLMAFVYFVVVFFQISISGDFLRMYYLNMPFFALTIAATANMLIQEKTPQVQDVYGTGS